MNAAPSALTTRDMKNRFYPFQIAAFSKLQDGDDDGDLTQLNVVYELIREGPLLLHGLATMVKEGGGVGCEGDESGGERRPNSTVSSDGIASIVGKEDGGGKMPPVESALLQPCKKRKR